MLLKLWPGWILLGLGLDFKRAGVWGIGVASSSLRIPPIVCVFVFVLFLVSLPARFIVRGG